MNLILIFEIIFAIVVLIYVLQQVIFIIGFRKKYFLNKEFQPSVTIIVAARNEEKNILNCLKSLSKVIYSKNKLQIIIVDDFSDDNTSKIIDDFIKDKSEFQKIQPHKKIAKLSGKTNAISNAIEIANGEIIVTTDADCIVPTLWLQKIVQYYDDETGIVTGYTLQKSYSIFSGMQNLDWVFLLTIASGSINMGVPLSCIGNNMSFRKKAYDEIGGYQNLKFSITEDFALLHSIHQKTNYKIKFLTDKDSIVLSEPCKSLKEVYRQKHRWGKGGLDSRLIGFIVMSWGFLSHLFFFVQIILFSKWTLLITLIKLISDFVFIAVPMKKFGILKQLRYFLFFEIYLIVYVLLLPLIVVLDRKVIWKERKY